VRHERVAKERRLTHYHVEHAQGLWSMLGGMPSGFFLGIIWLAEAMVLAPQPDLPATRATLEAGRLAEVLHPRAAGPAELGSFWQLRLHQVPQDEACRYLLLDEMTRKLNKKGQPDTAARPLVEHLALSPAQYAALAARFGAG